jgi:hypothetical protein
MGSKLFEKLVSILIAVLLFYAFIGKMFELSIMTGIGFIVACALAFYRRNYLQRSKNCCIYCYWLYSYKLGN